MSGSEVDITNILMTLVIFLASFYVVWGYLKTRGLPPTPTISLPVVGHLLSMNPQDPRSQMKKWREKVGDVFSLYLGPNVVIVLNGYDAIKEAFVKRADDFSDRPFFYFDWAMNYQGLGVVMSSGPNWKEQRSVSQGILRDLGMGKNVLAEGIQEEVAQYLTCLSKLEGKPKDIRILTNISVANVICSVLVGQRFDYEDPKFKRVVELMNYNVTHLIGLGPTILSMYPVLHYLPGDLFNTKIISKNRREFGELFILYFRDLKGFTEYNEANTDNFIAKYVFQKNQKEKNGESTHLDQRNLTKVIEDLLGAGMETTSTTISWFLLYMLHYPEIQEKIFNEINSEIGTEKAPTMMDKSKLKYLNAAIMETQRIGNIVPFGVTHMCSRDTTFRGFKIPKGAHVIGNMTSVFFDKTVWGEDVDTFRPERFLDDMGDLKHFEEFTPFSVGRRVCLGEALAKMELFLYLSSMCQRFQFLAPDPDVPPKISDVMSITKSPKPFEIRLLDRRS
ncbi:cytochrome P450 2B4 [Aplysia californica]|uniref:Cytochrome P450 2B4 n=1 Tax=Aplysia californica TaxID=6500 RepID=A0ABM0JT71_APLCA|nr:cytochrome P450 2B4 [Aplysia californica]XP_005100923.1 cytochrome P450 2B4 [Aplysia californica]